MLGWGQEQVRNLPAFEFNNPGAQVDTTQDATDILQAYLM